ncbi:MAG: ATP-binding protein, partial [Pseudobdellovibrionaceae bacterium]|nr:ATP-binding protein [Pseudobdellovibrionaceae bacterium]
VIQTDPVRLRQILINIIGNAIKFTEKGQVEVQLSLSKPTLDAASGQLVFTVRDTGTGISPERQQQLFQAFVQADQSIARVYGGTGLGLVLSRRLARALGGEVELVSSQPGQGSTFRITVDTGPLNEGSLALVDAQPTLPDPAPVRTPKTKEQPLSGLRVLVVDDSPENRLLIDRILARRGGAHVESVEDGLKAIEAALQGSYDIVLMDMQMPQMDGFEATATLRRKGYQKPIIALTAHAMKEERTRCLAAGCDDFLGKPIDSHQLFEKLIHYTGAHRPRAPKKAPHNYEHRH